MCVRSPCILVPNARPLICPTVPRPRLCSSDKQAYRSYLLAYSSHSLKNIYDVHELDLQAVARAFGFTVPPRVRDLGEKPAACLSTCRPCCLCV